MHFEKTIFAFQSAFKSSILAHFEKNVQGLDEIIYNFIYSTINDCFKFR